jgi:hypothetical protein
MPANQDGTRSVHPVLTLPLKSLHQAVDLTITITNNISGNNGGTATLADDMSVFNKNEAGS